jgi:tRNA(Ile)-lysidine synthase
LLTITGLTKGPALAARARDARYRILTEACRQHGILHLLLGHHAADQAETMMIRVLSGSGGRGLAGMPALTETGSLRILRPLLALPPGQLRAHLASRGISWVDDPSNKDPNALRSRLRHLRNDPSGDRAETRVLVDSAREAGRRRAANDEVVAGDLATRVAMRPEGYALLSPGPIAPEALAELLRSVAGTDFVPGMDRVAALAANPEASTVWGVRIMSAGRLGDGWLLVREEAAAAPPVPAVNRAVWDGRFRLHLRNPMPDGTVLGALGAAASRVRRHSNLPAAVLRVMPALWRGNFLVAVPQLSYPDAKACDGVYQVVFEPPYPLAGAKFLPA